VIKIEVMVVIKDFRNSFHMRLFNLSILLLFIIASVESGKNETEPVRKENPLKVLDKLLRGYDRRSTPHNGQGIATVVITELYIASLGSINTDNMDYTTDTYLRQKWTDPRLASEQLQEPLDLADPKLVQAIWKPEVFFPNAKEGDFQFVTMPNLLIRIHPDGQILYILRLRLKFSCMMELSRYPLDRQVCGMQISSFSKTTRELQLEWTTEQDKSAVSVAKDLRMPQFELEMVTAKNCDNKIHMGNYSCLVAQFHLKRSISFHLIQNYLPSILIVAVSWVSFWMDIESVPGRISLGVITLLAVSNQASGTNVPQTSYVKAIDIWMGTCTAFVFAALVEFTFVNYTWRTRGKLPGIPTGLETQENLLNNHSNGENHNDKNLLSLEMGSPASDNRAGRMIHRAHRWRCRAVGIDEVSRVIFPFGFTVFNISYWLYYLTIVSEDPTEMLSMDEMSREV